MSESLAGGPSAVQEWLRCYVDSGRLPGALALVARHGQIVLFETYGLASLESGDPVSRDTLFRIYSMTKPVTAVLAMILVERGQLGLDDRVATYIPSFHDLSVNRLGTADGIDREPLQHPMTIRHLLTHTSGLTYGEGNPGAVARLYETAATDFGPHDGTLEAICDRLASVPLLFQPGTAWNYGVSSDVLGRVIEVAGRDRLDALMHRHVFTPLGMADTAFTVSSHQLHRLASLYQARPDDGLTLVEDPSSTAYSGGVQTLSGGAGLISTADDYLRFAEMLRLGGELGGTRVLSRDSVSEITRNHLPGDLGSMGQPTFNETTTDGVGYGFGVSVVVDPGRAAWTSSLGEFAWGGFASTAFWVDPTDGVTVIFMTQVTPSDRYPIRAELRSLVRRAFTS